MGLKSLSVIFAAAIAVATPGSAAQVVQTLDLAKVDSLTSTLGQKMGLQTFDAQSEFFDTLIFNGFDGNLGTLSGATLTIFSTSEYFSGSSVASPIGAVGGLVFRAESSIEYTFLENFFLYDNDGASFLGCSNVTVPSCASSQTVTGGETFSASYAQPGLFEGPVALNLRAYYSASGRTDVPSTSPIITLQQRLTLGGTATLTYDYTPFAPPPPPPPLGGVPEPSVWALLVLGFGAIGAGLRGRRTVLAMS